MSEVKFTLLDFLFFPVAVPTKFFFRVLSEIAEMADREMRGEQEFKDMLEGQFLEEMGIFERQSEGDEE